MAISDILTKAIKQTQDASIESQLVNSGVGIQALKPHLQRAVQVLQPKAVALVMAKYRASGLEKHLGDLESVLKQSKLVLSFSRNKAKLRLALPAGLGEGFYKRVWSLDRGRRTKKGKTKAYDCFTLSLSERAALGQQITNLALSYLGALAKHGN